MEAMIVNPDLASRMRLKQAMGFVTEFGLVKVITTLTEALERVVSGEAYGAFFLSSLFAREVSHTFINRSKETAGGQNAAYIFTFQSGMTNADFARDILQGADGFLSEPFSVESLQKVYHFAAKISRQRLVERQRKSVRLVLEDVIEGIDKAAYIGGRTGRFVLPLRFSQFKEAITTLPEDFYEDYFDILDEMFESIETPRRPAGYQGASERVRQKVESGAIQSRMIGRIVHKG